MSIGRRPCKRAERATAIGGGWRQAACSGEEANSALRRGGKQRAPERRYARTEKEGNTQITATAAIQPTFGMLRSGETDGGHPPDCG